MKRLLSFMFLVTSAVGAQNVPDLLFANSDNNSGFGGYITTTATAKDNFGNIYLLGSFSNTADFDPSDAEVNLSSINANAGDMYIAKYDGNGNYIWAKNIGGLGTVTPATLCVAGNSIYVAGNFTATIDLDPSAGISELTANGEHYTSFMAKYDLNGQHIVSQKIEGDDNVFVKEIQFLNDQVCLIGTFQGTMDLDFSSGTYTIISNGESDAFVSKYNSALQFQSGFSFGGTRSDSITSLAFDSNGNMVISGLFRSTVDFDPSLAIANLVTNPNDAQTYLAKYSNDGTFQWVKNIGARGNSDRKLVITSTDDIVITGNFAYTSDFDPSAAVANLTVLGTFDVFLARYDALGSYVWAKRIGGSSSDYVSSIAIDSLDNVCISGDFSGTVDFDPDNGEYNLNSNNGKYYFAKYNSNGVFSHAKNLSGNIYAIYVDSNNDIMLAGIYGGGDVDFDPSEGTAILSSAINSVFLAKYTPDGLYVYAKSIGGDKPANRALNFIASDGLNNIYRAGELTGTADMDPSAAVFNVSSNLKRGLFISKYNANGGFAWAKSISGTSVLNLIAMNTDSNGNTYIIGTLYGTADFDPSGNVANLTASPSGLNYFFAKYDSDGNYLWSRPIIGNLSVMEIHFAALGNFYFAGGLTRGNPVDFNPSPSSTFFLTATGPFDVYMAKFNPEGNLITAKTLKGLNASVNWIGVTKLAVKGDYVYLLGVFLGTADFDPSTGVSALTSELNSTYFAKYNLNLEYQFAFNFVNSGTFAYNSASSITVDDDNEIYVTSTMTAVDGNVDFDPSPVTSHLITPSRFDKAIVLSKYTQNGQFLWAKRLQGQSEGAEMIDTTWITNSPLSFSTTKDQNLIIAFSTWNPVDFDPSDNQFIIAPANGGDSTNRNIVFAAYNKANGDFVWADKINGNYSGLLQSFTKDTDQNILISGMFYGAADFDFSAAVQNSVSASPLINDRFWAKYDSTLLNIDESSTSDEFVIYPNPTKSMLYVKHDFLSDFNVTLIDLTGKILKKTTLDNSKGLDVSAYANGIYVVEVESQNDKKYYKFIKQ